MSCAICFENFDLSLFNPQSLIPCNHTICLQCLNFFQNCPICHKPISNSVFNQPSIDKINGEKFSKLSYLDEDLSKSDASLIFSNSLDLDSKSSLEFPVIDTDHIFHNIDIRFIMKDKNNPQSLLKPGRLFLLEGVFLKECKKRSKLRHFFLFNDILVYGKKHPVFLNKLTSQHILTLQDMQIKPFKSNNKDYTEGIFIFHSNKSFIVITNSKREHNEWLHKLTQCLNELQTEYTKNHAEIKNLAPIWTQDKKAKKCMSCGSIKFNIFIRRHHCRLCGNVVCNNCSKNKFLLANISRDEPVRVCIKCYESFKSIY